MKKVMYLYRAGESFSEFLKLSGKILSSSQFSFVTIGIIVATDKFDAGRDAWQVFKSSNADILIISSYISLGEEYDHLVFTDGSDPEKFFNDLLRRAAAK